MWNTEQMRNLKAAGSQSTSTVEEERSPAGAGSHTYFLWRLSTARTLWLLGASVTPLAARRWPWGRWCPWWWRTAWWPTRAAIGVGCRFCLGREWSDTASPNPPSAHLKRNQHKDREGDRNHPDKSKALWQSESCALIYTIFSFYGMDSFETIF